MAEQNNLTTLAKRLRPLIKLAAAQLLASGLSIYSGTNATTGTATLIAGTKTVNTTKVTVDSIIILTPQNLGTISRPVGVGVTARVGGTSFTITSEDATDTSTIGWLIVEPVASVY
jgi:hypothetical protein